MAKAAAISLLVGFALGLALSVPLMMASVHIVNPTVADVVGQLRADEPALSHAREHDLRREARFHHPFKGSDEIDAKFPAGALVVRLASELGIFPLHARRRQA